MFIRDNFQFNRGIPNCQASGEGFTSVQHTYRSDIDTIADISMPEYFPPNFNEDPSFVILKDTILIIGSDGASMVEVIGLNPVVLGGDLFSLNALLIGSPIAAVDNNGLFLAASVLRAEFATKLHPGILSTGVQQITGDKTFFGNMTIAPAVGDFTGTPVTNGLQIRSVALSTAINIINTNALSQMGFTFGSLTLGASYAGILFSDSGLDLTPTLAIVMNHQTSIKIHSDLVVGFSVGLTLPTTGGTPTVLNYFEESDFTTTLTNDTSVSTQADFKIARIGNTVFITLQNTEVTATTSATPGATYISTAFVPARFLPFSVTGGQIEITVGSVTKTTRWGTNSAGQLFIYFDNNLALNYPAATAIAFGPGSLTYTGTL